jgi:hypothetical protein
LKDGWRPRLDSQRPYGAEFFEGRIPRSALRCFWAIFQSFLRDEEPRLGKKSPKLTCSVNKITHAIALPGAG